MENKKFEVGQFWKDSRGRKHQIMECNDRVFTYCYQDMFCWVFDLDGKGKYAVLTEPWQEPRSGEVWLNIFYDNDGSIEMGSIFTDKAECIKHGEFVKMIARIKMPWKEGEFHE
jgi:hypothetical protein